MDRQADGLSEHVQDKYKIISFSSFTQNDFAVFL